MRTLTLLALIALCACSKTPAGATTASAATPSPQAGTAPPAGAVLGAEPAKPVPAQLPEVLARVNGEAVNKAEFDRALSALEARNGGPVPAPQRDRIVREVLDQIVAYKLLIQESKTRKIEASDDYPPAFRQMVAQLLAGMDVRARAAASQGEDSPKCARNFE